MNKNITAEGAAMGTTTHNHKEHTTTNAPFHSAFFESLHKEQWQEVKLGEVAEIKYGKSHQTLKNGNFLAYGSGGIVRKVDSYIYDKESVLIPRKGSLNNIFYTNKPFWVVDTMFYTIINNDIIVPKFLFYCLKIIDFDNLNVGSAVPSLTIQVLDELRLCIPPLETQRKIAEILSSLDDKIDLLYRQNKTLESLALTLFRHTFIDNPNRNEWEEKPLSEVCEIKNGFAFKSEEYKKIGIPIIRTTNFKNGFIEKNNLVYLDANDKNKYSKYLLQANDFLLVMVGANLGKYAIVTNEVLPAFQNQNMWNFRVLGNVSQYYLNYAMQEVITNNINAASGSAREFFQKSCFYKIQILIPTENIMAKFHTKVDSFYHKIENNRKQIQSLESLRDIMLPKLLSGEVEV